jgi:hypothetical protein
MRQRLRICSAKAFKKIGYLFERSAEAGKNLGFPPSDLICRGGLFKNLIKNYGGKT